MPRASKREQQREQVDVGTLMQRRFPQRRQQPSPSPSPHRAHTTTPSAGAGAWAPLLPPLAATAAITTLRADASWSPTGAASGRDSSGGAIGTTSELSQRRRQGKNLFDSKFRGMPQRMAAKDDVPDVTAWQPPVLRRESVIERMHSHGLQRPPTFTSPKKLSRLEQERLAAEMAAAADSIGLHRALSLSQLSAPLCQSIQLPPLQRELPNLGQSKHPKAAKQREFLSSELGAFERGFEEKRAFADFVSHSKPNTLPRMVIKQFRHQICETSELVGMLRESAALPAVEAAIKEVGQRTIFFPQFQEMLHSLLGHDRFSPVEAQSLYDFFDSDGDGDLDFKELCNGFVLVLSRDGSLVSVMHRCLSLLHPHSLKDTRLTFMSRFELSLMAQTIQQVARVRRRECQQLSGALETMLSSFGCNRRGEFPLDDVRHYVERTPIIRKAIASFTVPRDPELYRSFISQFFRTSDAEEGEQAFRLMRSQRAGAVHRRKGSVAPTYAAAMEGEGAHSTLPASAGSSGSEPRGGHGGGHPRSDGEDAGCTAAVSAAGTVDAAEGASSDAGVAVEEGGHVNMNAQTHAALQTRKIEKRLNDGPVEEPGAPRFFTLRGVLYRQLHGEAPAPFWVEGMPRKVRYNGTDDRRLRSESPENES